MTYLKSFNQSKINEGSTGLTTNEKGIVQVSKLEQYQGMPDLVKALDYFENTDDVAIGPNSRGAENLVKLIIGQLKTNGVVVKDESGQYTSELIKAVKDFQIKKGLPPTGLVDQSTYNVMFGAKPLSSSASTQSAGSDDARYDAVVTKIIDNLEGGYYHPSMMVKEPQKFAAYGYSGETLFGLDRHAGHNTYYKTPRPENRKKVLDNLPYIESGAYEYASEEAKEFWTTVDKLRKSGSLEYNWPFKGAGGKDIGGQVSANLKILAGRIMKPFFDEKFNLLSPEAQKLVKSDDRLLFHFIYATWNGPVLWKKFAEDINNAVRSGITNLDELYKIAINSRLKHPNRLIQGSGEKILKIYPIKQQAKPTNQFSF
jgi:hypothetical protein